MLGFWARLTQYRRLNALALGTLEKGAMEKLWGRGECTVRELHEDYRGTIAYTTLMTTVDRLHKKGLLNRRKEGKAFVYWPRLTRDELDQTVARDLIGALMRDRSTRSFPLLACFVDAITEHDGELLSELEREIQKRRSAQADSRS